jgi:hypothetical protein
VRDDAAGRLTPAGTFYTWWRGDALPELPELPGFAVTADPGPAIVTRLLGLPEPEARTRQRAGDRPYLAELNGRAVGVGWCALRSLEISELGLRRALPAGDAYLWDFRTLAAWRGLGIYPHLLQYILRDESLGIERFWIGRDRTNVASDRGILKAGFRPVGQLGLDDAGALWFMARGQGNRAEAGATLLGVRRAEHSG